MRNKTSLHNNKFKRIVKERWLVTYDSVHASVSPDEKAKRKQVGQFDVKQQF